MSYRVALNFEDGATRIIDCKDGEKVLDAAYRNKINIPMDCSDGVCGTCKCRCEEGEYELGDEYIEDALTEGEAAEGLVLTCQMLISSDCVISVPAPSSACKIKAQEYEAELKTVDLASDSTIVLTLDLARKGELDFLPGQYVNLNVSGTTEARAYSFSSRPRSDSVSFLIRNVPDGLMSRWLIDEAKPGVKMRFVGPNGSFFLRNVERPVILLAGGTGLAPMLSMLEVLARRECNHPVHLIYGVNHDGDLAELERIKMLAANISSFTWDCVVADENSNNPLKGYVTHHLDDARLNGGDCDIYLCGPPPMVEAVRVFLKKKNVEPRHFYYEKFVASEAV
ncbi:benzoate 1,2-dioxygenase electron transfer component BenC [Acetobacter sp. DsW_063]|uniref:benzoate 1,2-dioxygenase electron transfer component BenC n=1 Tax=Acetobacter sp. DsW_063 TaxID=1514894 RepID=UPI000A399067|nr:benzoate 1,2-dioxygenase electron transfer component BenC [Acetobacter sp. DsW_063]OUJ11053.1 NADH oxidase [Acetobacter sp. DsW_063]